MTTPGEIDPYESVIFEGEIEATKELRRRLTGGSLALSGSLSLEWTVSEEDIASFFEALTRPTPGYREIANADGIHWYERIEPDGD
jgi:hypothetical protein